MPHTNECHSCLGDHLLGVQGRDDHPQPPAPDRGGARGLPPPLPPDHRPSQSGGLRGLQVR